MKYNKAVKRTHFSFTERTTNALVTAGVIWHRTSVRFRPVLTADFARSMTGAHGIADIDHQLAKVFVAPFHINTKL